MIQESTFADVASMIGHVIDSDYDAHTFARETAYGFAWRELTVKHGEDLEVAKGAAFVATSNALREHFDEAVHMMADMWGGAEIVATLVRELAAGWGSSVWDAVAREYADAAWAEACSDFPELVTA